MAYTSPADANVLQKWERKYFKEHVRESGFAPYMGEGVNNPFVVKKQLIDGGQIITLPLVSALKGNGKGTGTLVGNEENLVNSGYDLKPYWHRHAVTMKKSAQQNSVIDLLNASRDQLKIWDMDRLRDSIVNALSAVAESSSAYNEIDGHAKQVFFSEATTTQKNAWTAANQYRILFGATEANYSGVFATDAAKIDTTNDTLTVDVIKTLKRMAKRRDRATGLPTVRPIRKGDQGREYFIAFAHSAAFNDLQKDMETINLDGRPRDIEKNPVFQDGDLMVDGVIVREIPEIESYGAIGNGSAPVCPVYLCGAQALGIAWGQMTKATQRKEDDYGFITGVGTESLWCAEKLIYNNIDHGVVTGLVATTTL